MNNNKSQIRSQYMLTMEPYRNEVEMDETEREVEERKSEPVGCENRDEHRRKEKPSHRSRPICIVTPELLRTRRTVR